MNNLFYISASGQTIPGALLQQNTGFSPDTDPSALAANGIYVVNQIPCPYDLYLYTATAVYTISGDYADQDWVATPLPLAQAKEQGTFEVSVTANEETSALLSAANVTGDTMAPYFSGAVVPPASLSDVVDEVNGIASMLATQITGINAASTVDEINNIVNPPTGIITTSRNGDDFNPSSYISFVSTSLTEAETELYIPGTSTTMTYGQFIPGEFDAPPNSFAPGDYLVQIREAATGLVLADFICPIGSYPGLPVPF